MDTLLVQWSSHWAPRCAAMSGALGVPWRTCHTDNTSPCTARAARRARAAAFRQMTTAVVLLPHHAAMETNPGVAHGKRNGTSAAAFLVMRCAQSGPLFVSSRWPLQTG